MVVMNSLYDEPPALPSEAAPHVGVPTSLSSGSGVGSGSGAGEDAGPWRHARGHCMLRRTRSRMGAASQVTVDWPLALDRGRHAAAFVSPLPAEPLRLRRSRRNQRTL